MSKKALFITDYFPDAPNSVASILDEIIKATNCYFEESIICHSGITLAKSFNIIKNNKTTIICDNDNNNIFSFLFYLFKIFMKKFLKNERLFSAIPKFIEKFKPDIIIYLTFSPEKYFADICQRENIPFIYILYDTFLSRPCDLSIDKKTILEKYVMDKSDGYFIPDFFYNDYLLSYNSTKMYPYFLPLLLNISTVKNAINNANNHYRFAYFGKIQSFRNPEKVKDIFRRNHIKLDVFTDDKICSDDVFIIHKPVTGDDLYKTVAECDFLINFDNEAPFQNYLPSKSYLYVSFAKPIISFGNNEKSALKDFFSDYPYMYYYNYEKNPSDLMDFINKYDNQTFDITIYDKYRNYLPENALKPILSKICEKLK